MRNHATETCEVSMTNNNRIVVSLLNGASRAYTRCDSQHSRNDNIVMQSSMSYAGQNAWHAHILEIHSQALKHDVDIPDTFGTGQAIDGRRQYKRYRLAVLSCSLWLLYFWTSTAWVST